jgi:DNA repair exonuclease SbcCD ATPase subunit
MRDSSRQIEQHLQMVQEFMPEVDQLVKTPDAVPSDAALVEDELRRAEETMQRLGGILSQLDQMPTDGATDDQLNEVKKRRIDLTSALDRVRAWRDALARQLDALRQWHSDKAEYGADVARLVQSAQQLCDKYQQPQALDVAIDDVKTANGCHKALGDKISSLNKASDHIRQQLPDASKQTAEIDQLLHQLNGADSDLQVGTYSNQK